MVRVQSSSVPSLFLCYPPKLIFPISSVPIQQIAINIFIINEIKDFIYRNYFLLLNSAIVRYNFPLLNLKLASIFWLNARFIINLLYCIMNYEHLMLLIMGIFITKKLCKIKFKSLIKLKATIKFIFAHYIKISHLTNTGF